uniref:TRIO and F-actin-binding protein-like n=1 Tax=Ursus maritimus TaxID=29073 RepID=A0A452UIN4_URSMA
MEEVAGNAPCEHFEANVLAQSCCQNCFHPEEAHRPRHQEPGSPPSAGVPYCDLPRRPPASEDPPRSSTSGSQTLEAPNVLSPCFPGRTGTLLKGRRRPPAGTSSP